MWSRENKKFFPTPFLLKKKNDVGQISQNFYCIAEGRRKKEEGRRKSLTLSEFSTFELSNTFPLTAI
ncbi:MAG: hypothetical protein F6K17_30460 [Okeania sp. SIO3C4]|nr:hypothetical protein [Okeania sp. SIO3C4]